MNAFASVQKLAKAANSNAEAFQSLADIVFGASERLLALNLDAARNLCAYASANAVPVFEGDLQEQFASRMSAQGKSLEQAAEYFRSVNDLAIQTQGDIAAFGTQQLTQMSHGVSEFLDNVAKTAPAGSSDFVAAMKTAMSNASAAYENFVKTTRDVTETNLAAANSALQPMLAATAATTKASKKAA
ncbi:phasin family protein [Aromatoleum diolicum]|uniref:Phasin family protein n=1 Tax=Aromatoleum diolicum TaxID=75796 RepID=A0ABX1QDI1_9RHOO|nr:phasin family protein [Aromatoleum diolicum]NMG75145.1 phasin family protein [Aromatoleum diolicum]